MYAGSGYTFYRSGDGGDSWQRAEQLHSISETMELGVRALEFHPLDPSTVYVGCRGGLFKSVDDGLTWARKTEGYEGMGVQAITVNPQEPEIVYIVMSRGDDVSSMLKSTDGAESWTNITSSLPSSNRLNILKAVSHDELYVGGGFEMARSGQLYHSTDGGETWSVVDIGQGDDTFPSLVKIDPNDGEHIYIGFPNRYVEHRVTDPDHPHPGVNDALFMASRDGVRWRRYPEAWVRPGLDPRTHSSGVSVIPAREKASSMRANPPPLVPTIARAPAAAAPMAILATASSLSG